MDNKDLRKILGKLVSSENEDNWWRQDLFEKYTRPQIPSELSIISSPPPEKENYNCFVYVLGLQSDARFLGNKGWDFTRNLGKVFDEMIDSKVLEPLHEPKAGSLVVYRADDGSISHVGILETEKIVISKWSWGPLLRHTILDVPDHYGNEVEFYQLSAEAKRFVLKKYLSNYKDRKYEIVPYDPNWQQQFAEHAKILKSIFANEAISIEHIGSTAVPGLAGKPTIDVLILVEDVSVADRVEKQMKIAGYNALGEFVTEGARLFVKESNNIRYCNIHVFQKDHPHVKEMLQLRDYFRIHPEVVSEYSELKADLATKYPNDYGEYRKYKDKWMNALKQRIVVELED